MAGWAINPQEKIYKKIIRPNRTNISYQRLRSLGLTAESLRQILPRYNRRAVADKENPNNLLIKHVNTRPADKLPCMQSADEIAICGHAKQCYLAEHCMAAKKMRDYEQSLHPRNEDAFKRLRFFNLGRTAA